MSITILIIALTVLISYRAFQDTSALEKLKHWPYDEAKNRSFYRWLSGGLVHANWLHLLINMYVLYVFGEVVEQRFIQLFDPVTGRIMYVVLYFAGIVASSIPTFLKHRNNPRFASVGASGTVSGIVFAFILFHPWSQLLLFFIIPMPAIVAGVLFLIYSSYASRHSRDILDHDAHFYGAIFGMLFVVVLKPEVFTSFLDQVANVHF